MTVEQFRPMNSTGPEKTDLLYREYITGPQGMRFELFKELTHTNEDVERAKKWLRSNQDVVSISIIKETK